MQKTLLIALSLLSFVGIGQQKNSAQLYEDLKALKVLGSVLHVAAHPDDESTHMLTWFAQQQKWETNYFACTRGDGGQNLIGDEQGIALGVIRTQELLAARRIDGANQYFSRAFDFGFSKSTQEALSFWDQNLILSDLVWVIRKTRPDIIFTRFPPDARAGHGHHSASAVLAIEAFKAAADPKQFPEQLKQGVEIWQAKRLLWNTFRFPGSANSTVSEDQFKFEIGDYLPALGQSTGEIAAYSRSQHKSQGFGFAVDRGKNMEYFVTLGGETPKNQLWDGIDVSWNRIPGGEGIGEQIDLLIAQAKVDEIHRLIPDMIGLKNRIEALPASNLRNRKVKQINEWVIKAAGIHLNATTNTGVIAQGDSIKIKTEFIARAPIQIKNLKISLPEKDSLLASTVQAYKKYGFTRSILANQEITQPYWFKKTKAVGHFEVEDQQKIGQSFVDPAIIVKAEFNILGNTFTIEKSVEEMLVDPVKGEIYQPIAISPKTIFQVGAQVVLLPLKSNQKKSIPLTITALSQLSAGSVEVRNQANISLGKFDLGKGLKKGEKRTIELVIAENQLKEVGKIHQGLKLFYQTQKGAWVDSLDMQTIEYPHIPTQRYFSSVNLDILHIDLVKKGTRIAYIKGAGDKVPEALIQMGYQVDFLQEKDLKTENLVKYNTVITGIRAHNTLDFMENAYPELMKYVENGGNYVVQYNTASFLGPLKSALAPYPMQIGRSRITREDAKPEFLIASHRLLNSPNKITEIDFEDWVQERSIYTGESEDSHYEYPLGFTDPDEKSNKGNIMVTKYGKGSFIYTGLVFFRELPAGVPGAWRLFANLISNPNLK